MGVIYLFDTHVLIFKAEVGHSKNNFSELGGFKLLLTLDLEKGITHV